MEYKFNKKQIFYKINILTVLYSLCKSACTRKIFFPTCTFKIGMNIAVFISVEEQESLVWFSLIPIRN